MDAKALGRRIAEARVAAGMSQRQLAEVLGQLDHTSVSKVESGTRRVSATEMFAIAATLDPGHPEPVESDEQVAAITVDSRT